MELPLPGHSKGNIYIYIDRLNEGEGGYKGKKGLFDIFTIIITKSNCEPIHYIYI